jgi:hypothetical protein
MELIKPTDLVELQARVIIIKSYMQFLQLEVATMPQLHFVIESHLVKLQTQISELEALTSRLCLEHAPMLVKAKVAQPVL